MEKKPDLGTNMAFVRYLLLKEANIHINLICFNGNLDHPHIHVVTFVPRKQSKKQQFFPQKVFDMYLLLGLSSLFSQNSLAFLKNCYLILVPLKN